MIHLDPNLTGIIWLSLRVSGTAVLAATLLGGALGVLVATKRFPWSRVCVIVLNTCMGFPPVVLGLLIYLLISRSGPLGFMGLLFTPAAMIVAQALLATPIVAALTVAAIRSVPDAIKDTAISLGATVAQADWMVVREARFGLMAAIIAGFGRVIAEVGAVMMVGGNISGYTRVMTTVIALDTARGEFELAIAAGIILVTISLVLNLGLNLAQGGMRK
ncbi:MAG: ABC transporter permease [Deltaproteobacteria bacterium]|nr:ABC transporter permease [Deltaproteobacteria bacterium]